MMKDVIRDLATGELPLIGVLAFVTAFVVIVARVVLMSRPEVEHAAHLPLTDDLEGLNSTDQESDRS